MMKWFRRFLVAAALLVLLATTVIYLTPLDVYVPEVEQALSANLHEPVKNTAHENGRTAGPASGAGRFAGGRSGRHRIAVREDSV